MENKFILMSLDDERSKRISEVLGNKTCKRIIDYLANNKEASAKDISKSLKIPMNTADYNLKKLLASELIQKRKNFFWSVKGKKIVLYELSNKSIVISPKSSSVSRKLKCLVPAFLLTFALTFAIYTFEKVNQMQKTIPQIVDEVYSSAVSLESEVAKVAVISSGNTIALTTTSIWQWFLAGAVFAILIFFTLNWRKL
ncbi:MAG: helix-turn-helix domain-containing protein [Nanoarchaeota archaeon]|nr:helix-turn-helix domain-containing protein [Nanoarchaeota archaeon]